MNPILDAFLTGFLNGVAYTLWGTIAVALFIIILTILATRDDDDDDDSGTLQPVYQGSRR